jgi:hypothetical protein
MHKQLGNYNIILIIRCLVTDINKPVIVVFFNKGGSQKGGQTSHFTDYNYLH